MTDLSYITGDYTCVCCGILGFLFAILFFTSLFTRSTFGRRGYASPYYGGGFSSYHHHHGGNGFRIGGLGGHHGGFGGGGGGFKVHCACACAGGGVR